ncbi:MAG: rhomboid family intramembrane serine protease [Planctomycetaceae bacterium]|nr:rhomboid family intramembrane serine protease [Planctomycetaceae bacterium]
MGLYDRPYYRQSQRPGFSSFGGRSVVVTLIAINVAVWLVDAIMFDGHLSDYMGVHVMPRDLGAGVARDTLTHPWLWWQFLTAGFAHSPTNFQHILFNMIALFFFGRPVEQVYGSKEYIRVYLATVVFASIVWTLANKISGTQGAVMYGASGAIAGTVILFALNFPRATVLLFFVIPMPAWLAGVLFVGLDMLGAFGVRSGENIAFSAHLAGAAFAFLYYEQRWDLTRLSSGLHWPKLGGWRKPKLHVHRPDDTEPSDLSQEVDRILEKISRQGEASLTPKERKTLEAASRRYQERMSKHE